MKIGRYSATATVFNRYICIASGVNSSGAKLNMSELYDPEANEWSQLPNTKKQRFDFSLYEADGFLYATGSSKTVERYDAWTKSWRRSLSFSPVASVESVIVVDGDFYGAFSQGRLGPISIKTFWFPASKMALSGALRGLQTINKN